MPCVLADAEALGGVGRASGCPLASLHRRYRLARQRIVVAGALVVPLWDRHSYVLRVLTDHEPA